MSGSTDMQPWGFNCDYLVLSSWLKFIFMPELVWEYRLPESILALRHWRTLGLWTARLLNHGAIGQIKKLKRNFDKFQVSVEFGLHKKTPCKFFRLAGCHYKYLNLLLIFLRNYKRNDIADN